MSEMRFEDQQNEFVRSPSAGGFDLSAMLIKWGLASSRQQAEYVLVGIGIIVLAVAVFVYMSGSGTSDVPTTPNWGTATY